MDHNNFTRVSLETKKLFNGSISAKLVIMTLFYRKMGLTLIRALNELLRLIIIDYTFKYAFRIKTTLLDIQRLKLV